MRTSANVLVLEDEPLTAELVQALVRAEMPSTDFAMAQTLQGAVKRLQKRFDVAVVDLNLPDSRGLATVERMRREAPHLPIVVLSSVDERWMRAACLAAGASAFLCKAQGGALELGIAVQRAVAPA